VLFYLQCILCSLMPFQCLLPFSLVFHFVSWLLPLYCFDFHFFILVLVSKRKHLHTVSKVTVGGMAGTPATPTRTHQSWQTDPGVGAGLSFVVPKWMWL
jgi:hypothetical protein